MKRTKFLNILLALVMVLGSLFTAVQPISAAVTMINPSFEKGDLTGWTASNPDLVFVRTTSANNAGSPQGSYCARIKSNGPLIPTTLSQNISASAGDQISGWAEFRPGVIGSYNYAHVFFKDSAGNLVGTAYNSADYSLVGTATGWKEWSYTFSAAFNGKLEFSIADGGENAKSYLSVDDITCESLPTASAGGPYYVNEGKQITLQASSDNASGNEIYTWDWTYEDFNGMQKSQQVTGKNVIFSAAAINGDQDVPVQLTVLDGANTGYASATVHVKNVDPVIAFNPQSDDFINLGEYYNNTVFIADSGPGSVKVKVNYDDPGYDEDENSPSTQSNNYEFPPITPGVAFNLAHKFSQKGLFNVLVTVEDSSGKKDSKIIQVKVDIDNNTAPYITQPKTASYSATVGDTITIDFASYDIDADEITITHSGMPSNAVFSTEGQLNGYGTFTWDTTGYTTSTYPMVFEFSDGVLAVCGNADITLTINDSQIDVVIVVNNPPTAEAGGPYSYVMDINNPYTITLDGSASSDPDAADSLSYAWDLDYDGDSDASGAVVALDPAALSLYGLTTGNHPITLKVTDESGLFSTDFAYLRLIAASTFTITPSAGIHGTISPPNGVTVVQGTSKTFTITPDNGYHVEDVLVDGVSAGPLMTYTFTDINANHSIAAVFAVNTFAVDLSSSANPSEYGQPLTYTAIINPSSSAISVPDGTVQFKVDDVNLGSPVGLAVADANGQRSAVMAVSDPFNAGTYTIVAVYSLADGSNQTATLTQVINKITPEINWDSPEDIIYGTALSAIQLNAEADVDGDFTYSPAEQDVLVVGENQLLSVSFVPTDSINYNETSAEVSINVLKASPEFSNLSSPAIIAGTAETTLSGHLSLVPEDTIVTVTLISFSEAAPVKTDGTFSVTFDTSAFIPSGEAYPVTYTFAGDTNFTPASATGSMNVNELIKSDPVISWDDPSDIVYGTALSVAQLNATAKVGGNFTYTPVAGIILNAGNNQALNVSFAPVDSVNYNNASEQVYINVLPANTALSNLSSPTIDPGTTVTTLGGNVVGIPARENITISLNGITQTALVQADGTFSTDFDTSALVAGSSYIITYSYAGTGNYSAAAGTGDLAVSNTIIIMYSLTINCDCSCNDCDSNQDGTCDNNHNNGSNSHDGSCDGNQDTDCDCSNACNGTVTANPIADQDGKYAAGTVVTFTATANSGYVFTGWSGDLTGNNNPAAITMNSDKAVTATFKKAGPSVQSTNFVIWGGNQAKLTDAVKVGQTFNCWGSQWEKQIKKGSYPKNAAFKGWANSVSADGKTWTTDPGNSCNPPESISEYISVIVTTSVNKKGSTISGNIVATVVLKVNNPGSYQPNPGHPITGTVVSITLK